MELKRRVIRNTHTHGKRNNQIGKLFRDYKCSYKENSNHMESISKSGHTYTK